jgi:hypothetical protein
MGVWGTVGEPALSFDFAQDELLEDGDWGKPLTPTPLPSGEG